MGRGTSKYVNGWWLLIGQRYFLDSERMEPNDDVRSLSAVTVNRWKMFLQCSSWVSLFLVRLNTNQTFWLFYLSKACKKFSMVVFTMIINHKPIRRDVTKWLVCTFACLNVNSVKLPGPWRHLNIKWNAVIKFKSTLLELYRKKKIQQLYILTRSKKKQQNKQK